MLTEPEVTSIYERALGPDFDRLHPRVRERFGASSADRAAQVGRGSMDEVWRGRPYTLPFLCLGMWRRIMFPSRGVNVPFTVENYFYVDSVGRETVTWIRTFCFAHGPRRFDAYMIWSEERGCIVDYLGTHQHLAVDIHLEVDEATRGLRLRSGQQRFYERRVAFRFPMAFSGYADVCEWFDDQSERFRIDVQVTNPRWGRLFGYRGSFEVERVGTTGTVPPRAAPRRVEARE
jgi:Domain of unknown function (DUF4166)